jgi:peptide/nickel transport system permease protein
VLRGDLGDSIRFGRPVTELLVERIPVTAELSLAALAVAVFFGLPLGIISAVRHNSPVDVVTMVGANIGVSMPVFWLGLMLAYVFALLLRDTPFWLPPSGRLTAGLSVPPLQETWGLELTGPAGTLLNLLSNMYLFNSLVTGNWTVLWDAIRHLILPAVALGTIPLALIARITRSSLLEVMGQDYVRTARAKGLREWPVIIKHAFRNALLPIVTVIGLSLGGLLSGAVLTETIFGLSGVGRILYDSITARDYTVVQAFTLVIAVGFVVINLLTDLSYAYLDPRIRLS